MLQKYTITHGPSGRSVQVNAYTPEAAHQIALTQLFPKILGLAQPGIAPGNLAPVTAATPIYTANATNTKITDGNGKSVTTKPIESAKQKNN